MITLEIAKNCANPQSMIDRALKVATFYGFIPFEEAPIGEQAVVTGRVVRFDPKDVKFVRREERRLVSAVRTCALRGLGDRRMPAFLFKITPGEKGSNQVVLELHVFGMKTAAAEALLITVADAISGDLGIENRLIHINSIGAGESAERYLRELTAFLRKQSEYLSPAQRERLQDDPLGTMLSMRGGRGFPTLARAPSSMDYLSEDERRHFWDVLEYLELAGKVYELSPTVVGSNECWSHTLFEMSYPATPEATDVPLEAGEAAVLPARIPFALGGRYDALAARSLGPAAAAAHVAITFGLKSPAMPHVKKARWKPVAYLAHLGLEAKRRSIPILEILRGAEIPVHHSLAYDQIGPQMAIVKNLNIPWLLLMGHKEALANEVAVRNIKTNAQDSVPVSELAAYLHRKHVVA